MLLALIYLGNVLRNKKPFVCERSVGSRVKRFLFSLFIFIPLAVQATNLEFMDTDILRSLQAALGDVDAQALLGPQDASVNNDVIASLHAAKKRFASINFYQDYIAKYYPKALVITNHFFAAMTPEAVEAALKDIVMVFADRPFFYFVNDKKKFKITAYWECIVDQLSLINEFLCIAFINQDRSISFVDDAETVGINAYQPIKREWLFDWLLAPEKKVLFDFYALCFDYTVKLFNEGILLPDFVQATRYLGELEWIAEKLRGSIYESDYAESIKTAKELYDLLKQRMGLTNNQFEGQNDWV